jgi:hypothetical protein
VASCASAFFLMRMFIDMSADPLNPHCVYIWPECERL